MFKRQTRFLIFVCGISFIITSFLLYGSGYMARQHDTQYMPNFDSPVMKPVDVSGVFNLHAYNTTIFRHLEEVVPRVVYYVIFKIPGTFHGDRMKFEFTHAISILSAHRFIKPKHIYVTGNWEPTGEHWDWVKKQVPELEHKYIKIPTKVHGIPLKQNVMGYHASDTTRIKLLMENGGIYLDTDAIVAGPIDEILHYDFSIGRMSGGAEFGNGILLSRPKSTFIQMWWDAYRSYKGEWNIQSTVFPKEMSTYFGHLMHIEFDKFYRPDSDEKNLLYRDHYDWSKNYFIHIWWGPRPSSVADIKGWNATIGELYRKVVYGSTELLETPKPWRVVCQPERRVHRCRFPTEEERQKLIKGEITENDLKYK